MGRRYHQQRARLGHLVESSDHFALLATLMAVIVCLLGIVMINQPWKINPTFVPRVQEDSMTLTRKLEQPANRITRESRKSSNGSYANLIASSPELTALLIQGVLGVRLAQMSREPKPVNGDDKRED